MLGSWATSPLLRGPISAATMRATDLARRAALESYPLFLRSAKSPPDLLEALSPVASWRAAEIQVRLHAAGSGPFAANSSRVKRRYIVTSTGQPLPPSPLPQGEREADAIRLPLSRAQGEGVGG